MKTDEFAKIKQAVFSRQVILSEIYQSHGSKTLAEYVAQWSAPETVSDSILPELLTVRLAKIYGKALAQEVSGEFQSTRLVSTIDHHGLFGHPFFTSANLIFAQRPGLKYLPVLTTSGVSLNNSSWPGCLVLTNPKTGHLARISLFNDSHKTKTVFKSPSVDKNQVGKFLGRFRELDFLENQSRARLVSRLEEIFFNPEVLSLPSFSDQACLVSHKLWQMVFPEAPQLVYLPLEDLVADVLAMVVCREEQSILHTLLFMPSGWGLLDKYFMGVRGAYGQGRGSFLFWGLDQAGRRVALSKNAGRLVGGGLDMEITPATVRDALLERKIYPTSLVCFLVMLCHGVTCVGGFNQTTWLTEIKERFFELLVEMGEQEETKKIQSMETKNFAEGGLAFVAKGSEVCKASGLDIYLGKTKFASFVQLAKQMTLAQSIESELPEIYRIAVPEKDRQDRLSALKTQDILAINGLKQVLHRD